jgi:hypothetical protein
MRGMTLAERETDAAKTAAPSDEAALLDYLRVRDVACPLCAYNLRGLTAGRCPECGRALQLSVGLTEPRIGAWVMCLVAVTASGALGVLAVLSMIANGWRSLFDAGNAFFFAAMVYFLASIPAVAALIVLRRRYRRLPQRVQWGLAVGAAVLTAGSFGTLVSQ